MVGQQGKSRMGSKRKPISRAVLILSSLQPVEISKNLILWKVKSINKRTI